MEFGNVVFEEMEKSEYQEKTPRIKGVHQATLNPLYPAFHYLVIIVIIVIIIVY